MAVAPTHALALRVLGCDQGVHRVLSTIHRGRISLCGMQVKRDDRGFSIDVEVAAEDMRVRLLCRRLESLVIIDAVRCWTYTN